MLEGLSLFFPCHNEASNVEKVIQDALRVAPQVASRYEVIIVDDGSTDRTSDLVQRFRPAGVRLVRHEQCRGYGAAVRSGLFAARYPWVFFSDGDGQFDLDELPRLVELSTRADIISGIRVQRADPWHRVLNARLFELSLRVLFGLRVRDVNCAFKLFRRDLFDRITLKSSGAMINAEIFLKAQHLGYAVAFLPVSHRPRRAGRQSGAHPQVIFKAMREFLSLWRDVRGTHGS
jgi:glycosyltransferase involved in cell wall biosynthesis